MTQLFQFHRPKPAAVVNAFERARSEEHSIFATADEIGRAKAKLARMSGEGQANIQASNDRLNKIIRSARAARK